MSPLAPTDSETTLAESTDITSKSASVDTLADSETDNVCTPEHCFYAFDALYCALTGDAPVKPQFADEK